MSMMMLMQIVRATPTTDENIEAVKKMILDKVAHDVGILLGSCQAIFIDVADMKYAAAKIVPIKIKF